MFAKTKAVKISENRFWVRQLGQILFFFAFTFVVIAMCNEHDNRHKQEVLRLRNDSPLTTTCIQHSINDNVTVTPGAF